MTWVIGRAGPFGYAVGLSDVRVTLNDGTEFDCLQKIYKVGPQIVFGFAGSVAIGLEIVAQLARSLRVSEQNQAWNPKYVADLLPFGTRRLFDAFPDSEKDLGCELLMLATHPNEQDGAAPWAKCQVYRFFAPYFEPIETNHSEIVSIGSGSCIEPYVKALQTLNFDYDMFQLEVGLMYGAGYGLMVSISSILNQVAVSGISRHLHFCFVGRDSVKIGTNNIQSPSHSEDDFIMPPVATNIEELRNILASRGSSAIEQAKC